MNPTLCRSFSSRRLRPLLGRYQVLPYDIFRVQSGSRVFLRDHQVQKNLGRRSYDLHVGPGGIIQPSVGNKFNGPNGCSVRPKGLNLDEIVDGCEGSDTRVYRLPKGLNLPQELVLLHEHTDHHALQCAVPMSLEELNRKLTNLLANYADMMSRSDFFTMYGSV